MVEVCKYKHIEGEESLIYSLLGLSALLYLEKVVDCIDTDVSASNFPVSSLRLFSDE